MELVLQKQTDEIKDLETENLKLENKVIELKEQLKGVQRKSQMKIKMLMEEKDIHQIKSSKFKTQLTHLEIENESHNNRNRINEEIIKELRENGDNLFEKMTILQMESEQIKNQDAERLQRMKEKLKETEEEMLVLKKKSKIKRELNCSQ